jgi:hypothetical protein
MIEDKEAVGSVRRINIGVVGDAGIGPDATAFRLAEALGSLLIDSGYRIVTGGLGGVMEAACRGARMSKSHQPGDTIGILPGPDPAAANPFVDIAIPTGLDHVRNSIVAQSDAVVAIGGGAGTLSEICFAWMYKRMVIALGSEGWASRVAGRPLDDRTRYANIPDDRIYAADSPEEVLTLLKTLLSFYQKQPKPIS